MEEKTPEELFEELRNELFKAVQYGDTENAKSSIQNYGDRFPELINAVATVNIPTHNNQQRKLTTPLLLYILRCAKHQFSKKDKTKEAALLDLAQFVLDQPDCNILGLDSDRNTALHHAIWYIYPEIARAIISKAQQTECVKQICAIKNRFKENANYVLFHALKQTTITPETALQLNQIRVLITQALEQEKQFRIEKQQQFAETSKDILTGFYQELEDVVEDPITLERLINPVDILPEGNTLNSSFFTDSENKKPNVNPTTQSKFEGCDLYVMAPMPEKLTIYVNSYILTDQALFYIKNDGQPEKIAINTVALLDNLKKIPAENPFKYYLSDRQVQDIITSSSKHIPFGKGHRVPHLLATEILNLYLNFPTNQAEEFFIRLDSLLYSKLSSHSLIQPCVIAEKGKVFNEKKLDLYGHTCNEFEVSNINPNVNTYKDLLVIKLLELKEKCNQKLEELAKSAEEQAKQSSVAIPDEITLLASISTSMATEKSAMVEISDVKTSELPTHMRLTGAIAKVFKIYSTKEYLQKIENYLCQNIFERFNYDKIQCALQKDHIIIAVIHDDKPTMSKVEEFFVEHEKLLTQEQIQQGGIIITGLPINPHHSNVTAAQPPKANPVVFSNIPSPKPSPKPNFPKPIEIKYQQPLQTRSDWGEIVVSYNLKHVPQIVEAIKRLDSFANIKQSGNNILIKISSKQPDQTKTGIFLIKEGQQDMLYIKFPNQETMNNFIAIFDLESYISQYPNDNEIKIDPHPFQQQTTMQQKISNCSVM